jgi:cytochrome c
MDASKTSISKRIAMSVMAALSTGCMLQKGPGEDRLAVRELGHQAAVEEITPWNIDMGPNGDGLPPGRGTVPQGATIYAAKCAKCHGPSGTESPMDRLVGGRQTPATPHR